MTALNDNTLHFPSRELPRSALSFIALVVRGRYRLWLLALVSGEAINALCGILLPYALNRIITTITGSHAEPRVVVGLLIHPLVLFGARSVWASSCSGRVNSAVQLRVTPRQRQYVARALFSYLHRHSHRFLNESFAGALANRINETSHGVNQVLWALITEFWPTAIVIFVANLLLVSANRWLGLFTGLWSVAFIIISLRLLARRTQPLGRRRLQAARSHTVGMVVDSVANHATVRLFAQLEHERSRLECGLLRLGSFVTVLRANLAMERVRTFQFAASALLKAGTVAVAVTVWSRGRAERRTVRDGGELVTADHRRSPQFEPAIFGIVPKRSATSAAACEPFCNRTSSSTARTHSVIRSPAARSSSRASISSMPTARACSSSSR